MTLLVLGLTLLVGCAGRGIDAETLRAQGYQHMPILIFSGTARGERQAAPEYEFWAKETTDAERRVHLCLIPKVRATEYNWRVTVSIDGKEVWSYERSTVQGTPDMRSPTACAVSPPLPEGRLNYGVWFSSPE